MALIENPIESLGFPITLAFSNDGRTFFSERITGNLWEIDCDGLRLVRQFPIVPITGHHETGLLGIALDPNFDEDEYIYCFYTYGESEDDMKNKVVRIPATAPGGEEVLIDDLPAGRIHNGGVLAFAPDKTLFICVGVQNEIREKAQDLNFYGGKVLRINRDGTIPVDNPFNDSPVYSYGHRNIFGLAFHPRTGRAYISEQGPEKDDEINIIKKGANYGWPYVTGIHDQELFENPLIAYTPTITPTQSVFTSEKEFYFGSYNDGTVHKLTLSSPIYDQVEKDEIVYSGRPFGVIGVFYGPDKQFYLTTPSKILPFKPKI